MTLRELIEDGTADWVRKPPASADAIAKLRAEIGIELPPEYFEFLALSNGGEGSLECDPWWFRIDGVEKVLERNRRLELEQWCPNHFRFGGTGGGAHLLFRTRDGAKSAVVMIPCIPSDPELEETVTPTFLDLVRAMGRDADLRE